jgi:Zn-dependent membrane protease YugP
MIPWLILILPTLLLGLYAQWKVQSAYSRNARIASRGRITGAEAAAAILRKAGIRNVEITETPGHLTDHYDPTHRRLVLSSENYHGYSLAALGVAAHEAGHAIQHAVGYKALKARMALVPATSFASKILPFALIAGILGIGGPALSGVMLLAVIGVYAILTLFQLITLPVEFDASARAKSELVGLGILSQDELPGVVQTLNAAALTYVAAFVTSLAQLLYYLLILFSGRREE